MQVFDFDASKDGGTPSSGIHMELGAKFKQLWNDAEDALDRLADSYQYGSFTLSQSATKLRIIEDDEEDVLEDDVAESYIWTLSYGIVEVKEKQTERTLRSAC